MNNRIIDLKEHPEYLEAGIEYFSQRWGLDDRIYADSMTHSVSTESKLPRFYLMMLEERIIGGYSLLINDFVSRQDLWPYLSTLYIEECERGKELGAVLLDHGRREAGKLGFEKVYLCTDHVNYYEKYGWKCIAEGYHPWNRASNIYVADTIG